MAGMLRTGLPLEWLARFFGMTEADVEEEARPYGRYAIQSIGGGRHDVGAWERLRTMAVAMRKEGKPEAAVAAELVVSPRQVRRWCQGVGGILRNDGNRSRRILAAMTLERDNDTRHNTSFRQQCDMVRGYIERTYTCSHQNIRSDSAGNMVLKSCNPRETRLPLE